MTALLDRAAALTAAQILGTEISSDNVNYQQPYSDFARQRLKILDKQRRLVPFVYNAVQQDLIANLTGRDLILKARQLGMSTVIQGLLYQEAVTTTATTITLSNDDENTAKLRRITERFYKNDPRQPKRELANARLTTYPATDSEAMIATAGTKTAGRASTLTHIHASEVAFFTDAETVLSGALQAGEPKAILESTANGAQGYFYTLCMEALDGNSAWRLHFYPWWSDPSYQTPLDPDETITYTGEEQALAEQHGLTAAQIKWRRNKQAELKSLFPQEFAESPYSCFLLSGNGYFGDVSASFIAPPNPVYNSDHRYVAGLDFGQTNDFTALSIIDATIRHEVARLRINRLLWGEMRHRVATMCKAWHVGTLIAEGNSMGTTNIEELRHELSDLKCATTIRVFWTSNDTKASIASALHETLHSASGLKLQYDPIWNRELGAFAAVQLPSGVWRLEATAQEHDDTVIARMLAYHGISRGGWSPEEIAAYGRGE